MGHEFVDKILKEAEGVAETNWVSDQVVGITRSNGFPKFKAAIIKKKVVEVGDIQEFAEDVDVIVNFTKVGSWSGAAIELCNELGIAWGRYAVLLRALGLDDPSMARDPEIEFSRRALAQHSKVLGVSFHSDHLLVLRHSSGKIIRVGLVYEYDLTAEDVRDARDRLGNFDVLLKTNPNGSILPGASDAAESMGATIYMIGDLMSYLAKLK